MKRVVLASSVFVALALTNLPGGNPSQNAFAAPSPGEGNLAAVTPILEEKCANCHTSEVDLPFYAYLPVAGSMIENDRSGGLRAFDLERSLQPAEGSPAAEPTLAKIEYVIATGSMPPARYVLLHWNSRVTDRDHAELSRWIGATRAAHYAPAGIPAEIQAAAVHPLPRSVQVDARKAALGKLLYHDKRLSGDDTISCASCHALDKGGTDQAKVSQGIRGQLGGINAPTTFNAAFQTKQFWDGRAATLQEQAGGPPLNPVEMGSSWEQIVAKLEADESFAAEFRQVYPQGLSDRTITDAIAAFEMTLLTPDAPFDRYLLGQSDALGPKEKRGWELFGELGCQTCHVGKLLGGQSFEILGRRADYFGDRGTPLTDGDNGRFNVTKDERDRHKLKVPTLRNVARTFPYFHDGSAADLPAAVRSMARYQVGEELADPELASLVKFLESLTGTYEGKPL